MKTPLLFVGCLLLVLLTVVLPYELASGRSTASTWFMLGAGCVLTLALLFGCASRELTPDERFRRDDRETVARNNWRRCEQVLRAAGVITVHDNHTHGGRWPVPLGDVRSDLARNRCRAILREGWAEPINRGDMRK